AVSLAITRENVLPHIFRLGEDHRHELLEIVLAGGLGMLDLRSLPPRHRKIGGVGTRLRQLDIWEVRIAAAARRSALQDHARVDAKEEHQPENDENAEDADPAAAARAAAWKANAAA